MGKAPLYCLCAVTFVLLGVPRLNVKIGPIPIYAIDVLLVLLFVIGRKQRMAARREKVPFVGVMLILLCLAVLSEVRTMVEYLNPLEPTYVVGRTLIAFSLFFSTVRVVGTTDDLRKIFLAGAMGIMLTAAIMILSSIPQTRGISNFIFSFSFLEPASDSTLNRFDSFEQAMRGRSLVGVSILSGYFITTFLPLAALLYRWPGIDGLSKRVAFIAVVIAPLGIIAGYSRGTLLGLLFVLCGVVFFGSSRNRRGIVLAVAGTATLVASVGWDSELFYFERIQNRTIAMIENPYENARETERIYAYTEPFEHVLEHPSFLMLGEGNAVRRMPEAMGGERSGQAYHAMPAAAYYAYGLVSAILYSGLVVGSFFVLRRMMKKKRNMHPLKLNILQALFSSLLGILPWLLLGHAAITNIRGSMLLYFLFGLIAAQSNLIVSGSKVVSRRSA